MKKKGIIIAIIAVVVIIAIAAIFVGVKCTKNEYILEAGTYVSEDGAVVWNVESTGDGFKVSSEDGSVSGTLKFRKFAWDYTYDGDDVNRNCYTMTTANGEFDFTAYVVTADGEKSIIVWDDASAQCYLQK